MMKIARRSAALLMAAAVAAGWPAGAQSAAPAGASAADPAELSVVTIKEAVDSALSAGEEKKIADGNLAAAQAGYDLALSRKGIALSGSGSYSMTDAFGGALSSGSSSLRSNLSRLVGSEGANQSVQGSLALSMGNASASNPYSKLTLSIAQSIPPASGTATTTLGASLAQTVWDGYPGGQTNASVEKASISLKVKELASAQSRSTIAANAKKAFVTMLTAQRTVALRAGALDKQSASLRQIEAMFSIQQASAVDRMNARVLARTAELDLETARHDLEIARRRLAALMGRDAAAPFAAAELEEPELPAGTIEEAVALGLEKRSDAAQLVLNRRSAAIDLALTKASSQPSVSASAGLNMGIVGGSDPGDAFQASLGARVSMPILDSGAAEAQVAAAAAQLAVYDANAVQLARSIESDIRDAYWMAAILRDRVEVAAQARDVYEKKLELVKTQLQFGTATNQDLLSAQSDAANYGAAYLKAKGDYLLQEIALETAMGL
jgi:outer membrane protein